MSLTTLNLPTEIPWERICVTKDMVARGPRDLPGKWRSSIAVFQYVPGEDYQAYEGREISYLKVAVTVCGYQAKDKEVEGAIRWGLLSTTNIKNLNELLSHYHPCIGALVQVAVTPEGGGDGIGSDDYPYLMDFQPKKRELYEVATDTNESMSRSLEGLNVRKASGTTETVEAINIDQGGSGSGELFWGAIKAGGSSSGQWGTKRISSDEQTLARTTDQSRERREGQSHTTQLSQVYTLFDSYHQGTNRGVFFLQPRPHTLEEPSGFVTGPRKVEGIQEIFLVVNRLKDGPAYCVSVRLDTAHLVDQPILDYDRPDVTLKVAASAPIPHIHDPDVVPIEDPGSADRHYKCVWGYKEARSDWQAPLGYTIDHSNDGGVTVGPSIGDVWHEVDPTTNEVSLVGRARSRGCVDVYKDEIPAPEMERSEDAIGEITVHSISLLPTSIVGQQQVLMVTTRGLDCCSRVPDFTRNDGVLWTGTVKDPVAVDDSLGRQGASALTMSAREANALSDAVRARMQKVAFQDEEAKAIPYLETDLFANLVRLGQVVAGQGGYFGQPASRFLSPDLVRRLERSLRVQGGALTAGRVAELDAATLAELAGIDEAVARRLRLDLLGVPLTDRADVEPLRRPADEAPATARAPLLIGLEVAAARRILAQSRLALGSTTEADSPMPRGSIIDQIPAAGDEAPPGSKVAVTFASGPTVRLPEVTGLGLMEAVCRLREAGLKREPIVEGRTGSTLHVLKIDPPAGALITPGAQVTLKLERDG